jgi:hypothetical protein
MKSPSSGGIVRPQLLAQLQNHILHNHMNHKHPGKYGYHGTHGPDPDLLDANILAFLDFQPVLGSYLQIIAICVLNLVIVFWRFSLHSGSLRMDGVLWSPVSVKKALEMCYQVAF